jgi:hypothetical protein
VSHTELARRGAVLDVQHDYGFGIDLRDWTLYRSVFAEEVHFDFTSWYGGAPFVLPADDWVDRVRARQSGFDGTQHQMTNPRVAFDADGATCVTYVVARHYLRIDDAHHVQAIGGYYTNRMVESADGWRIAQCRLTVLWTHGDRGLFDIAAARFSA